jgi:GntR family transcriptional repressor for pyruvate dehydrogenase complex
MQFEKFENKNLSEKIVEEIVDLIKSNDLVAGQKLPSEPDLARQLGVSRGALREALSILTARKIISRKPREGTVITEEARRIIDAEPGIVLREGTYQDLIEMRICIESRVVEKIIDNVSDEDLEILAMETIENDRAMNKSIDYYFHYRMAELSGNVIFMDFIDSYYEIISEMAKKTSGRAGRKKEIAAEHRHIYEALCKRDKKAAVEAIESHLKSVYHNLVEQSDKHKI